MKAVILICLVAIAFAAVTENKAVNETEIANQKSIIQKAAAEAAAKANARRTQIEAAFEKRVALEAELAVAKKHKQDTEVNLKNALRFLKKQGKTVKAIQGKLKALWKKTTAVAKNMTAKALNTTTGQKIVNATKAALNSTNGQKLINATHAAVNVTKGWASRAGDFLRHAANATKNAVNSTIQAVKNSNTTHAIVNATKNAINATKTVVNATITKVKNSNTTKKAVNATKKAIKTTIAKVNTTVKAAMNSTTAHKIANATKKAMDKTEVLIAKLKTEFKATAERIHLEDKLKTARALQVETLDKIEAYLAEIQKTSTVVSKLQSLVKAAKEQTKKLMSATN